MRPTNPPASESEKPQSERLQFYRRATADEAEGPTATVGFVSPSVPGVIFINADARIPLAWTIAHESIHVAEKDPGSNLPRDPGLASGE